MGSSLENAMSLIPSKVVGYSERFSGDDHTAITDNEDIMKRIGKHQSDINDEVEPIVNESAAIGKEEMKLISILSEKIHKVLKGKPAISKGESPSVKFSKLYGKPIGIIGHGSYGIVKVCTRPRLEDDFPPFRTYSNDKTLYFAVKELKPKSTDQIEKISTRITSEFIIGYSLSHSKIKNGNAPNILSIIDLMENNDTFVEVMEFCPSGDLYRILTLSNKALHPLEADCFMKQLLTGVSYMHDHGVAHCDLKPENILFYPNGLLKICDFGTSRVFQTGWERNAHYQTGLMGSKPYVAPEEFIENREYDSTLVDCWSCGVVYCTMILGHFLWEVARKDKDDLYAKFCQEMSAKNEFYVFEELRHINHDINRLRKSSLYKIFQSNPENRISVGKLLQSPWMKVTKCCIEYK